MPACHLTRARTCSSSLSARWSTRRPHGHLAVTLHSCRGRCHALSAYAREPRPPRPAVLDEAPASAASLRVGNSLLLAGAEGGGAGRGGGGNKHGAGCGGRELGARVRGEARGLHRQAGTGGGQAACLKGRVEELHI